MTQAHITRQFAADPAGVALLLSGPVADALWPATDRADVDAAAPTLRVGSPMRAGVGFVVDLTIADPDLGSARGRLALLPETAELPIVGTNARLVLTATRGTAGALRARGEQFLDALGSLAVARSSAA
ncbi:MAG TPA: hypothetical protein VFH66_05610 [Mycobacteriales bacterium]|nr:hypothetical protein [Mycobacteriales bacterium]